MLMRDPNEPGAIYTLAEALLCMKDYAGALPLYERMDVERRADPIIPGDPGRTEYIAIIHWMLEDRAKAISLFTQLVDGILDGSINYGDLAGGVQQGLMLFYMGATMGDDAVKAKALKYLRTRVKRTAVRNFSGQVARFYLGEIDFSEMLIAATKENDQGKPPTHDVASAIEIARADILTRRFLCIALFHDGAKPGRAATRPTACSACGSALRWRTR